MNQCATLFCLSEEDSEAKVVRSVPSILTLCVDGRPRQFDDGACRRCFAKRLDMF